MGWLALGTLALLGTLLLLRAFSTASVAQVRAALVALAAVGGLALAGLLALTGRGGQVFWAALLFGPAAWRWWRGRRTAARFAGPGPGAAPGDAVRTDTLEMRLDPAAGAWTGTVRRGAWAGRDLGGLDAAALLDLLGDCAARDPESVPLLEAWLDRAHPGWRDGGAAPGGGGPMRREEALAVLGLGPDAGQDAVRAAYTRLMRAAHPDAGGSDWLAARLNEARDALLRP